MTTRDLNGWLSNLLGPTVKVDGEDVTTRRAFVNFVGATQEDDPDNDATNVTISAELDPATISTAGSMSAADKAKLDGIQKQGSTTAIAALNIDWSLSGTYSKTLSAGGNTFTFSNATDGQMIVVRLTGAASTVTWPTVKWPGGVAPTQTASGIDVYTFVKEGSTIYGSVVQAMA